MHSKTLQVRENNILYQRIILPAESKQLPRLVLHVPAVPVGTIFKAVLMHRKDPMNSYFHNYFSS